MASPLAKFFSKTREMPYIFFSKENQNANKFNIEDKMDEITRNPIDSDTIIMRNSKVSLQEEADGWGILYNRDLNISFVLNHVSAFVWNYIKDNATVNELIEKVKENFVNVSENVEDHMKELVDILYSKGLIQVHSKESQYLLNARENEN